MTLPFLRMLRRHLIAASVIILSLARAVAAENPPPGAFAEALADLKRERINAATIGSTLAKAIAASDAAFARISLESLGPREIAELVRWRAFDYGGDAAKARAKAAAQQLETAAAAPDIDGALALVLRTILSAPASIKGEQREKLVAATLQHPAYVALLNGEFGDLALDAACRVGLRDGTHRDFVLSLAGKLDATKSAAASTSVREYWSKIKQAIPEGEARQTARQRLADYLSAALARSGDTFETGRRERIEDALAQLNSPAARGQQLEGNPAPELHFVWSNAGDWKSLSDLRGKVVVLDFWATWCSACIESFPEVARLAERYRDADVVILGVTSLQGTVFGLPGRGAIDCRGNPEKELGLLPEFIKARGITWPVAVSREKVMNPDYGINGIPTLVIIAPDGTVRKKTEGFAEAKLVSEIDALLREFRLRAPAASAASE